MRKGYDHDTLYTCIKVTKANFNEKYRTGFVPASTLLKAPFNKQMFDVRSQCMSALNA